MTGPRLRSASAAPSAIGANRTAGATVPSEDVCAAVSKMCRRASMRLGFTDEALASATGSLRQVVARWRSNDDRVAPSLMHLAVAPDEWVDAIIGELLEYRAKNGKGLRRLVTVADERSPDSERGSRMRELEAAQKKMAALSAEVEALVSKMTTK